MLYIYKGKIYVKPFSNKIVEVTIKKIGNNYDVKAEKETIELNSEKMKELSNVTLQQAYEHQNKTKKKFLDE